MRVSLMRDLASEHTKSEHVDLNSESWTFLEFGLLVRTWRSQVLGQTIMYELEKLISQVAEINKARS